jgi:hypothetical protein
MFRRSECPVIRKTPLLLLHTDKYTDSHALSRSVARFSWRWVGLALPGSAAGSLRGCVFPVGCAPCLGCLAVGVGCRGSLKPFLLRSGGQSSAMEFRKIAGNLCGFVLCRHASHCPGEIPRAPHLARSCGRHLDRIRWLGARVFEVSHPLPQRHATKFSSRPSRPAGVCFVHWSAPPTQGTRGVSRKGIAVLGNSLHFLLRVVCTQPIGPQANPAIAISIQLRAY